MYAYFKESMPVLFVLQIFYTCRSVLNFLLCNIKSSVLYFVIDFTFQVNEPIKRETPFWEQSKFETSFVLLPIEMCLTEFVLKLSFS